MHGPTRQSGKVSRTISLPWPSANLLIFGVLLLFVASVSVHDAMLVALHDEIIAQVEKNPVGRWLIELARGEVWLFIVVKLAGTSVVCAVLLMLYERCKPVAFAVAAAVAGFQLGLLLFLSLM